MLRSTSPRTAILFRTYYGLLAISLVLSSVLINRHMTMPRNAPAEIILPASSDQPPPHRYAPTINWGGHKR